jgi:hypothetical protein
VQLGHKEAATPAGTTPVAAATTPVAAPATTTAPAKAAPPVKAAPVRPKVRTKTVIVPVQVPAAAAPPQIVAADPGAYSAYGVTSFVTPSGNIDCSLYMGQRAFCEIERYDFDQPGPDCQYGGAVEVNDGSPTWDGCASGPISTAGMRTLPYGASLSSGEFTCSSASSGVTCTNTYTGRGFSLSREALNYF